MVDFFRDDLDQMAVINERIDHPVPTHDAAANLVQQLKAKDDEIAALRASHGIVRLNLTAAVDTWLADQRHVLDEDCPNPETPECETWDKLDRIHGPLLDCVATALRAAQKAS